MAHENIAQAFEENPYTPSEEPEQLEPVLESEPALLETEAEENQVEESQAEESPEQEQKERFEFDYNGEKIVEELSREEINKRIAKYRAAEEKMKENSETEKQLKKTMEEVQKKYEAIMNFKANPIEAAKQLGLDFDSLSKEHVLSQFEYDQMTQEQKDAYDAKKKLQEYQNKERIWKEEEEKRIQQEEDRKALNHYQQWATKLVKEAGLPENEYNKGRFFAEFNKDRLENNFRKDEEILQSVKDNFRKDITTNIESLKDEEVVKTLGLRS